jgi:acyl-[acyl carrier protein]--UDP-N-acetylglucosamine O-acyltransferase
LSVASELGEIESTVRNFEVVRQNIHRAQGVCCKPYIVDRPDPPVCENYATAQEHLVSGIQLVYRNGTSIDSHHSIGAKAEKLSYLGETIRVQIPPNLQFRKITVRRVYNSVIVAV